MAVSAEARNGATSNAKVNLGSTRTLADHSAYSRKNLGDAIYGDWYERHCVSMQLGSAALLKRILEARA